MLSKLKFAQSGNFSLIEPGRIELSFNLKQFFGNKLVNLCAVSGGTLGISFKACLNSEPRFFKTHAVPSGHRTLQRESSFLRVVASEKLDPHLFRTSGVDEDRVWLHTRLLDPGVALNPTEVLSLIAEYELELSQHPELASEVSSEDTIFQMLSEAEFALSAMVGMNLVSARVADAVHSRIEHLKFVCAEMPMQVCHGDLGPANIMISDGSIVAIDWEDVFWGIAGYDYLYWLTFFENRKWLSKDSIGITPLGLSNGVALMVAIILLKSWITVLNDSYRHNTISFDQRLLEVLSLG